MKELNEVLGQCDFLHAFFRWQLIRRMVCWTPVNAECRLGKKRKGGRTSERYHELSFHLSYICISFINTLNMQLSSDWLCRPGLG